MKISNWINSVNGRLWVLTFAILIISLIIGEENRSQDKEIVKLHSYIDTLLVIDAILIKQDSTVLHLLTCRDSSAHEELALRDTCGIWAYTWVKYFSREYPWIEQRMKEDNKVVE